MKIVSIVFITVFFPVTCFGMGRQLRSKEDRKESSVQVAQQVLQRTKRPSATSYCCSLWVDWLKLVLCCDTGDDVS